MNSIELWPGGPELFESRAAQPLSTDSVLLADFVRPSGSALGLDLGSGSGVLSVILMHRLPSLKMALCEIDPGAAELSRENLELNGFSSRASVWAEDMRGLKESKVGRFDFIITNPPYFPLSGGRSPDSARDLRRVEVNCSLSELCAVSAALLGQNGRFYIVYPASRMAELVCRLSEARLEPKRLRLVQARADAAPSLVLIEAAKLGKPGVIVEPALILRNPDGTDTEETKTIYHKGDKIMSGTLYLVGTPIGNLG
ncbi:MAG: methyltransferase, partial [Oscillospiraceae bacterium]|nr:methyltransferase [Oscillospiraceae bacterium]